MKRYSVRVLGRAQRDLVEIDAYARRERGNAGGLLLESLLDAMDGLASMPARGAVPRDRRLRALGFRYVIEASYLMFYKIVGRRVLIYRVLHGRREYQQLL